MFLILLTCLGKLRCKKIVKKAYPPTKANELVNSEGLGRNIFKELGKIIACLR